MDQKRDSKMDISEAFTRIKKAGKNVADVVVINKDNYIIRSSNGDIATKMTSMIQVIDKCRSAFKENDELEFLKVRTKKCEYLAVPDKEFMLVALLNPADESIA